MSISSLLQPNEYNINMNSLVLPNSSPLDLYLELGYSTNVTGPITGSAIGLFRQIDRVAFISLNGITGTSSTSAPITFTTPAQHPAYTTLYFPINVIDNGTQTIGTLKIDTSGNITVYKNFSDSFTGSGTCGFNSFSISYCCYI
jgi:hypothetical protein